MTTERTGASQSGAHALTTTTRATARTMSSREIAELVEARHNDVVATIERLFAKGLLRSSRETRREMTGGRPVEVYDLIERDTHLVVSGYSDEHRARVIDRWQELEAAAPPAPALPNFADPVAAARAWADQLEARQQAEQALALAAPKVEFVDRYVVADTGSKGFRQVAKLLKANEARFREFLSARGVLYRLGSEWTAYQCHIDAGRFEIKTGEAHGHAFSRCLFTPKGIEWIAGEWAKHQVKEAACPTA